MSGDSTLLWLFDSHHMRRASVAAFLSGWTRTENVNVRQVSAVDQIAPSRAAQDHNPSDKQICLLVIGGASFADPYVTHRVPQLMRHLGDRPLVVMADNSAPHEVQRAIALGIRGMISTRLPADVALAALKFMIDGGSHFPHETGQVHHSAGLNGSDMAAEASAALPAAPYNSAETVDQHGTNVHPDLTPRQVDVLSSLRQGRSNKEIARVLNLSEATVKIHVRHIMRKFGAENRTQVALMASGNGAVPGSQQ